MLVVLIIIPVVLFLTGVIQTFVLKSKQAELANSKYTLEQSIQKEKDLENEAKYKESDEYIKEFNRYNNNKGEEGDIGLEKK